MPEHILKSIDMSHILNPQQSDVALIEKTADALNSTLDEYDLSQHNAVLEYTTEDSHAITDSTTLYNITATSSLCPSNRLVLLK